LSHSAVLIKINLRGRRLYLYQGQHLFNSYAVAIGKPSTPSPIGTWSIVNKKILDGRQVYGTRWMGLSKPNYGIHGTNNPHSIGKAVSLGCIRMYNHDIEKIFTMVPLGTSVEVFTTTQGSGYPLPPYHPLPSHNSFPPDNSINPSPEENKAKIYVVKQGDSLWTIAQRMNIDLQDLINSNPGINPDLIYPEQVIYLP
jgi:LysM repeat protein